MAVLEAAWRQLYRRQARPNPFLGYAWVNRFCEAYAEPQSVLFWCYEKDGDVAAIAPLQRHGARLSLLHHRDINDYCGVLAAEADPVMAESFVNDMVATSRGGFHLPLLRADDRFNHEIAAIIARRGGNFITHPYTLNPYSDLPSGSTDVMAARPKRLRQEIRTTINHLNRMGTWRYEARTSGAEAQGIFAVLQAFHLSRQEGKAGASIFQDDRHAAFLKSIIGGLEPDVQTHLSALRLDGRVISAAYSLIAGDTLYYWIPSFDPHLPSVSLGKLQIAQVMQDCVARGLGRFDFMGGEEAYKYQWAGERAALQEHLMYSNAVQRSADLFRRSLRSAVRDAAVRHPLLGKMVRRLG